MQYNFSVLQKFINMGICSEKPKNNQKIYDGCYAKQQNSTPDSRKTPQFVKSDQENTNSTLPSSINPENKTKRQHKSKPAPLNINKTKNDCSPQTTQKQQKINHKENQEAAYKHLNKITMPKKITLESPAPIRQYKLMALQSSPKPMENVSSSSSKITHTNTFGSVINGLTSVSGNSTRLDHVFQHQSKFMDSNPSPGLQHHYGAIHLKAKRLTSEMSIEEEFVFDQIKKEKSYANALRQQ